jgi:hypothetical protein
VTALLLQFCPYILGAVAAVFGAWKIRQSGVNAERNKQRAKEADSYEKSLKELADAAVARNSVDSRVPDHDPYRRD